MGPDFSVTDLRKDVFEVKDGISPSASEKDGH